jgi:DNA invertase Pin-like site-specific DNA recombinase
MIIGYARTSTIDQQAGFEAQINHLNESGVERLFKEQVSSVAKRDQLEAAMEFAREGDMLVVTKLDRLARSVRHLCEIVDILDDKKVSLRILDMALDTSNANGRLMLNVLGSVAQFEREMMLERQLEGIAKAKSEGKYKGRPSGTTPEQVKALKDKDFSVPEIMIDLGISRASVYRLMKG